MKALVLASMMTLGAVAAASAEGFRPGMLIPDLVRPGIVGALVCPDLAVSIQGHGAGMAATRTNVTVVNQGNADFTRGGARLVLRVTSSGVSLPPIEMTVPNLRRGQSTTIGFDHAAVEYGAYQAELRYLPVIVRVGATVPPGDCNASNDRATAY